MRITDKQIQFLKSLVIKADKLTPSVKEKYGLFVQLNKIENLFKSEASDLIKIYLKALEENK